MSSSFKIPFKGRGHSYSQEEIDLVVEIMSDSDTLTQGKYLQLFEQKYREFLGVDHAFAMSSATSALEIAAQLLILSDEDEVIIPSHTYTSSAYPFVKKGAKIVWADIDFESRVVNAKTIESKITNKTRAVVVVHLYGYIADMPEIRQLCTDNDLILIEDCAQSLGTSLGGKRAGTYGDMSIFSLHSQKNISTLGEGGVLVVKNPKFAEIVPMLRHNGHLGYQDQEYYWKPAMSNVDYPKINGNYIEPNNYCLGEPQCAVGSMIIDRVDSVNSLKRSRAIQFIDDLAKFQQLIFHRVDNERHNYQHLVAFVQNDKRDQFIKKMFLDKGIQCVVQYHPLHRYPYYIKHDLGEADCPNTELFFDSMVSFPFYETMKDYESEYMLESTISTLKSI